jgi:DNA ligase (NAD+)
MTTFPTQVSVFNHLQSLGFDTPKFGTFMAKDLKAFYEQAKSDRDGLDYDIDGIVLSTNSTADLADLGFVDRDCPKGQIALKFPAQTGFAIIREIETSADGQAHLSPVAIFDPIELNGAEIRRASLKSFRWVQDRAERVSYFRKKAKDAGVPAADIDATAEEWAGEFACVGVGTVVEIARSGDVIPVVKRVISNAKADLTLPKCCPSCNGPVAANGAFIDCINDECRSKEAARMRRFLEALRVKGLGQDTLVLYADAGVTVADFFEADFSAIEAKIANHPDISKVVWRKIRSQLEA